LQTDGSGNTSWVDPSAGDASSVLSDGGFDTSVVSGEKGLVCVGTCTQETTIKKLGVGSLKIALTAQAGDVKKCFDNTGNYWAGKFVEVRAFIKTAITGGKFQLYDDTSVLSEVDIDSSDTFTEHVARGSIPTTGTPKICWRITTPSTTNNLYVDKTFAGDLRVDGTTRVLENTVLTANNDGRVITANSEDVYFIGTGTGWNSSGDVHQYQIQNTDSVIELDTTLSLVSQPTMYLYLYKNNSLYKIIGQEVEATSLVDILHGSYTSKKGEFAKGDLLSIRANRTITLTSSAINHYLNIKETKYEQSTVVTNTAKVTNEFTARIENTAGTPSVISTNTDWIDSLVDNGVGQIAVNIKAGLINFPMACTCTNAENYGTCVFNTNTTSQIGFITRNTAAAVQDTDFDIKCTKQSTDFNAEAVIVGDWKASVNTAKYSTDAGQSINSGTETIINFEDMTTDANNLVTVGAGWKYTAKAQGPHRISGMIMYASHTPPNGAIYYMRLYKNGVADDQYFRFLGASDVGSNGVTVPFEFTAILQKDDYVDVRAYQSTGSAKTLLSGGQVNYISITKLDQAGTLNTKASLDTQYNLTVSADSCAGWSTTWATGIPYQTTNGDWYINLNIKGDHNSLSLCRVSVSGITVHATQDTVCSALKNSVNSYSQAWAVKNTSTLDARHGSADIGTWWTCSNVRLNAKPSFVP